MGSRSIGGRTEGNNILVFFLNLLLLLPRNTYYVNIDGNSSVFLAYPPPPGGPSPIHRFRSRCFLNFEFEKITKHRDEDEIGRLPFGMSFGPGLWPTCVLVRTVRYVRIYGCCVDGAVSVCASFCIFGKKKMGGGCRRNVLLL